MKRARYDLAIAIDAASSLSLQHQVRQRIIDAVHRGVLRPGRRLPSSRALAEQIGVSRNTITLAYDALLAEGHLVSRARSGIFVAPESQRERVTTGRRGLARAPSSVDWLAAPAKRPASVAFRRPPSWHQHPYPFLDGCIDPTLVPVDEWREALRLAFAKQDLLRWSVGGSDPDDEKFADELRTKVLPSWGIDAAADEVVGVGSLRHALHLVVSAIVERSTPLVVDAALDDDIRQTLTEREGAITALEWRGDTARLQHELPERSIVVLDTRASALSRERAAAVLAEAVDRNAVIVECRASPDLRDSPRSAPSLRALDKSGRVVLVGALAATASLGEPPGFVNGDARIIERVRQLRHAAGAEYPTGLQRAWAYFIGLGHYAAAVSRAHAVLHERRTALRDALNHYLHKFVSIRAPTGSSAYWVTGGPTLKAQQLALSAAAHGILIEPGRDHGPSDLFCMGVTSLPRDRIRPGVERLARLIRGDSHLGSRHLRDETAPKLAGKALQRALSGVTLLYNTVYGEPCTIQLRSDGTLIGRSGYANEDCDGGRWWVDNDRWFRQWNSWAYGEVHWLHTVIDGDQVRWFSAEGLLADTAVIVRSGRRRAA